MTRLPWPSGRSFLVVLLLLPGRSFGGLGDMAKWRLCFLTRLGRLEVLPPLILFYPGFWRR